MVRYTGPLWKKERSLDIVISGTNSSVGINRGKRNKPILGQHGSNSKRKKRISNYSIQNTEKQKLRFLYGLRERQVHNLFAKLKNKKEGFGHNGYNVLLCLESRLDNLVFRSGIGVTRRLSRQLVNHGHFLVNGKKIDIPSYILKIEDVVQLSKKSLENEKMVGGKIRYFLDKAEKTQDYINFDFKNASFVYSRYPTYEEIIFKNKINVPSVIECYNQKI